MNVCRCECTYLTSVQWWPQSGQCRCYWQAGRQFPSRQGHSASCEILGWACAGCHKRSWSSRRHGGAGSHNHSPYWCYTPVFSPYCSLGGSRGRTGRCVSTFFIAWPSSCITQSPALRLVITHGWYCFLCSLCLSVSCSTSLWFYTCSLYSSVCLSLFTWQFLFSSFLYMITLQIPLLLSFPSLFLHLFKDKTGDILYLYILSWVLCA